MKAIVIFWILIFLSFLEATLPGAGYPNSEQEGTMIEEPTVWPKEEFLSYLEDRQLDAAKGLLKISIEKSPKSVRDIVMEFIEKDNVNEFKFMIEEGPISPDINDGLFLNEACEKGQKSIVNYLLRSTKLLLLYADKCLFVASKKGDDQLVKVLLNSGKVDPAASCILV